MKLGKNIFKIKEKYVYQTSCQLIEVHKIQISCFLEESPKSGDKLVSSYCIVVGVGDLFLKEWTRVYGSG